MLRTIIIASLAVLSPFAASARADEVTIDAPIEAGSLHDGRLDMVAYYTPAEKGLLEVTATFLDRTGGEPLRIVMGLADKDAVGFSVPGYRGWLYRFARQGDAVLISGSSTDHEVAAR